MQNQKSKIRICFLAPKAYQLFNPEVKSTFGGAEVQFYILAKELAKDHLLDVCFIVGDYGQPNVEKIESVTLYKFPTPRKSDSAFNKIFHALKLWKLLAKIRAGFYLTTTSNSVAALVSAYCKSKKAFHIHRTSSDEGVNLGFIRKNGLMGKLYKYGLEKADLVVTQSEEHKELLKKNHFIDAVVVKNSIIGKTENEQGREHLLWVSRCHPLKKPELFLELARQFKKEKFVMVCPPSSGHKPFFEKTKREASKIANVTFIDFVPFAKIQSYFDKAKVFICTSDYEGFPNTLIQSGIGGTPFLSLRVNPDSVLTKYNCGFFAGADLEKMKADLQELIQNDSLWRDMSRNIRDYTLKYHDVAKNSNKIKELIIQNAKK